MLINQQFELENIYDEIITNDFLEVRERDDLEEIIINIIDEFMNSYPHSIAQEDFYDQLENYVEQELSIIIQNFTINEVLGEELEDIVDFCICNYFKVFDVPRSFDSTFVICKPDIKKLKSQIKFLEKCPQPEQRTTEWYLLRSKLITASNVYKAFESESTKNQLIYEKCKTLVIEEKSTESKFVNTETTLHWGQKYEPLSVLIYEHKYGTKIQDFGCIVHPKYNFLGASPDGINVDENNDRYGRMLEIKNIVNREITGIPKKEYWVQMQQQMEVCELDECDFLETKFVEISKEEYLSCDNEYKGVIMYFSSELGEPKYIYKPLNIKNSKLEQEWIQNNKEKYENEGFTWISNLLWKLEKYSCVLVPRNKRWFNNNIYVLMNIWETIEKERLSGYEHRKPRKKEKTQPLINQQPGSGCLLKIEDSTKVTLLQ